MLTTRVRPTAGTAAVGGIDVVDRPTEAKRRIGVVTQTNTLDRSLDVWHPALRTWFPEGKDDPSIALIRVHPAKGEYWDSPSSTFVQLYGSVKAALTGQPATEIGEQRKVSLR